jgi:serine protease AprX
VATSKKQNSGSTTAATTAPVDIDNGTFEFETRLLDHSPIALPLLDMMEESDKSEQADAAPRTPRGKSAPKRFAVIIDVHLEFPGGREAARNRVQEIVDAIKQDRARAWRLKTRLQGINVPKSGLSNQYLFGEFESRFIRELVRRDQAGGADAPRRAIYRIWPDFEVKALLHRSISTVKADAALQSFATTGDGIVWAVLDSGIDGLHPHFAVHANLDLGELPPIAHLDFTGNGVDPNGALVDRFGHGTHVAGIIAGLRSVDQGPIDAVGRARDEKGEISSIPIHPHRISGMAPRCKLLSLKVLNDKGQGQASSLIAALEQVQRINNHGRYIRVHGVNLSVGYNFEPEWFACGQSPLCVEVDRLVKSGVVVVVAAGNTGYGTAQSAFKGSVPAGLGLTINDPGNADLAITVGSTHRDMPHIYGVSYFSSKGPTGDGRAKPDLVAPGEKIVSCASSWQPAKALDAVAAATAEAERQTALQALVQQWQQPHAPAVAAAALSTSSSAVPMQPTMPAPPAPVPTARYREDSGTSMAAPHVSGVIAAFLSVRREFIGRPDKIKEVFVSTATDLKRDRYFQGGGLVDLMRAIQSV